MVTPMEETRWWTYVAHLIGPDSFKDAAEKAQFDKSAFSRWKKGAKADPEFAVKLARAYGANVLEALVESGLISQEEANLREVHIGGVKLTDASPRQLAEEFLRRMNDAESQLLESNDSAPRASVSSLHDRDELVERINAGLEQVAAQEATEPLEENQP